MRRYFRPYLPLAPPVHVHLQVVEVLQHEAENLVCCLLLLDAQVVHSNDGAGRIKEVEAVFLPADTPSPGGRGFGEQCGEVGVQRREDGGVKGNQARAQGLDYLRQEVCGTEPDRLEEKCGRSSGDSVHYTLRLKVPKSLRTRLKSCPTVCCAVPKYLKCLCKRCCVLCCTSLE